MQGVEGRGIDGFMITGISIKGMMDKGYCASLNILGSSASYYTSPSVPTTAQALAGDLNYTGLNVTESYKRPDFICRSKLLERILLR